MLCEGGSLSRKKLPQLLPEGQGGWGEGGQGQLLPAPPCCPVLQAAPPPPQYRPVHPKQRERWG